MSPSTTLELQPKLTAKPKNCATGNAQNEYAEMSSRSIKNRFSERCQRHPANVSLLKNQVKKKSELDSHML